MSGRFITLLVILAIGYVIGAKFPTLAQRAGIV
jgi:hypothetical protein